MATKSVVKNEKQLVTESGVFYKISKHSWSAVSSKVRGNELPDDAPKRVLSGKKNLIDRDYVSKLWNAQSQAENVCDRFGYRYKDFGKVWFIPKALISTVDKKVDECVDKFYVILTDFINNYGTYKEEWKKISGRYYDEALYPSQADLESRFYLASRKFIIDLPSKESGVLNDEQYKIELEKQKNEMKEFIDSTLTSLASNFFEIVKGIEDQITQGKTVNKKRIENLKIFAENFDAMNITNHKEMKIIVDKCFKIIEKVDPDDLKAGDKGVETIRKEISTKMTEIIETMKESKDQRIKRAIIF
jgi:hypothetical protein